MPVVKKNVDGKYVEWTAEVQEYLRDKAVSGEKFTIEQLLTDLRVPQEDRTYVRSLVREVYSPVTDFGKRVMVKIHRHSLAGSNIRRNEQLRATMRRERVSAMKIDLEATMLLNMPTAELVAKMQAYTAELNRRFG